MHRLAPHFILEKHAKGQTSGHIDAFVLFADISGFITTSAGDAFTAVFPADDQPSAERALAAAWSIRKHLASHCEQETRYDSFPVGVKLGLAYGEAQWGIVQSDDEERATYYFRGAAIDAAAGAEKSAEPGNLVITPAAVHEIGELATGEWVDESPTGDGAARGHPRP